MDKKIAIVTGATGSIGYKIVESLLDNDYKIIALARNKTKLENLKKVSRTNIKTYSIDLRISAEIKKVFKLIKNDYNSIDLLVNSAGGGPLGGTQEILDDEWESNINLKILGYIRMSREVIPFMKPKSNGRIINIVGTFGKQPSPFFVVGSVTNAALLSFTKALSLELDGTGITVNAINPSAVKSLLWSKTINQILASENKNMKFLTDPSIKLVFPEDIANAVLYLADDKSKCITGTSINIDNGIYSGY